MLVYVVPPLVLSCHWMVGVGLPLAVALKAAVLPGTTVRLVGCKVTAGVVRAADTVSLAAVVVAVPFELVKTARNRSLFWATAVVKVYEVDVAPAMLVYVVPPLVLTCHWTVAVGLPEAEAVNLTDWPAGMPWLTGFVVTTGAVSGTVTVSLAAVVVAVPFEFVKTARNSSLFCAAAVAKV